MGLFSALDDQIAQYKAGKEAREFVKNVVLGKTYYCIKTHKMVTGDWGDLVHEYVFDRMSSTVFGTPMPMSGTMSAERAWNLYGPFFSYIPPGLKTLAEYSASDCTNEEVAGRVQKQLLRELKDALVRV